MGVGLEVSKRCFLVVFGYFSVVFYLFSNTQTMVCSVMIFGDMGALNVG